MSTITMVLAKAPVSGIVVLVVGAIAASIPGAIIGWAVARISGRNVSDKLWGGVLGSWYGAIAYLAVSYFFGKEFLPGVYVDIGVAGARLSLELLIYVGVGSLAVAMLD